jgi:hypothetical protein
VVRPVHEKVKPKVVEETKVDTKMIVKPLVDPKQMKKKKRVVESV